mmetsp:Transcript_8945/g.10441  ORF Transcript_8945/g.10441 Transcript_8945/m.10441 type:complete len:291 (-) Transcript_8945:2-874(-)
MMKPLILLRNCKTKQLFWKCATAAAFTTVRSSSAYAYLGPPISLSAANRIHHVTKPYSSRIYSSSRNNDEDESNGGSLSYTDKAKSKVKSFFPFLKKDKKIDQSELAKKNISTGIDTMLKDAPLAVRLMGKIISPIIGKLAGTMAKTMEEQSRQLDDCLDDARNFIIKDGLGARELGEPVVVGRPFNQSSSSMSMNGQTKSNVQAQFEVQGSVGTGIASMNASDGKILTLNVVVNGENYSIDVDGGQSKTEVMGDGTGTGSWKSQKSLGKNQNIDTNDIIDVEFTDKVEK